MTTFNFALARREATDLVDVTGGVAVLNRSYPISHAHNRVLVTATSAVDVSVAEAERVLGGAELSHRRIDWVDGDPPAGADRLMSAGWTFERSVHMCLTRSEEQTSVDSNALTVPFDRLRDTVLQVWLGELRILDLDGRRVAQIEDVINLPAQRGHGHASAVVRHAVAAARARGCDVVWLEADADDCPQHLYRKLGFDDVGRASSATLVPQLHDHR